MARRALGTLGTLGTLVLQCSAFPYRTSDASVLQAVSVTSRSALPVSFSVRVDRNAVGLGRVVNVTIDPSAFTPTPNGTTFWPFVNGSQYGSFVTCAVTGRSPRVDGGCSILLPLAVVGSSDIKIAVLRNGRAWGGGINTTATGCQRVGCLPCDQAKGCVYPVGTPFPAATEVLSSSPSVSVEVLYRKIKLPAGTRSSQGEHREVCMDWEPWHTRLNTGRWIGRPGASAIPLVGMYSSYHTDVIRQHAIWLIEAGVTCIEIDWSNSLWGHQKWAQRGVGAQDLNNATVLALQVYAEMRREGHDVPKALFMIGLQNGPPATPSEVGNEATWIRDNLISTLGRDQFVQLDSKPLLLVLYCGNNAVPNASVTHAVSAGGDFTVRWMATQLQENPDLGLKRGFWSWMDGSIEPVPTLRSDGSTEALTVTPAFFAGGGWLAPAARAQDRGATLTAEMAVAVKYRPTILLVCQWNEWAGQPDGKVGGFVDAYNLSFTNDLEPTSLAECGGYQHASDAGQLPVCDTGWGFFNLNLLRATLQVYRDSLEENVAKPTTVLRISHPPAPPTTISAPPVIHETVLRVEWATVGPGENFQISIDTDLLTTTVTNTTSATLDLGKIPDGLHTVAVTVVDGKSAFPLARESLDLAFAPDAPYVAAYDSVTFELRKPSAHLQTVLSATVGFVKQPDQLSYEYGPTIIQENGTFYNIFCSPGGFAPPNNDKVTAWDVIRMTTSTDGRNWSEPSLVLEPSTTWDRSSVCDPSLVKFRGTYFLYHTCINTCTDERAPQDGYFQNRICVALADNITGPFRKIGKPVIEDLTCAPGSHNTTCAKEIGAYCVGQPSATVIDDDVVVFYSSIGGVNDNAEGPNPGRILAMTSSDGVNFVPRDRGHASPVTLDGALPPAKSETLFTQRDVDIRYDRMSKQLLMLQGDVGANQIFWSLSDDLGLTWLPWADTRTIAVHNVSTCKTCNNHNPGLAALSDGSFGGQTFALVASSFESPGKWGQWHLFRTDVGVAAQGLACGMCAPAGCDHACSRGGKTMMGKCVHPNSTEPGKCCECEEYIDDLPCARCASSAGGCVELCRRASKNNKAGMCAFGDNSTKGLCCTCFE